MNLERSNIERLIEDKVRFLLQETQKIDSRITTVPPGVREGQEGDNRYAIEKDETRIYIKSPRGWEFTPLHQNEQKYTRYKDTRLGHRHIFRFEKPSGMVGSGNLRLPTTLTTGTTDREFIEQRFKVTRFWVEDWTAWLAVAEMPQVIKGKDKETTPESSEILRVVGTWNGGTTTWTFYPATSGTLFTGLTLTFTSANAGDEYIAYVEIEEI